MFSSGRTEALASDSLFFVFVFFIIYIHSRNTKKRIIPGHCLCQNVFLGMALSVVRLFLLGWKKWHMSVQATIFLHVAANCFFAIRNIVQSSSGFPSSLYNWLIKIFFSFVSFQFSGQKEACWTKLSCHERGTRQSNQSVIMYTKKPRHGLNVMELF